ncbi:MAG: hypothetical protein AAB320_04475 [Elusimicrobiota bacterium]
MKESFSLQAEGLPITLRAIGPDDLEELRSWKNANKEAFFFKGDITPEMQETWFSGYLERPRDFMFMVMHGHSKAGSLGFRMEGTAADCYNIMGAPGGRSPRAMSQGMKLLCSFIVDKHTRKIGCKVVEGNKAVAWYERQGYRIASQQQGYVQMSLDVSRFKPLRFSRIEA